jgi:tetratricopeptide (TPR) repeat protein
MARLPVAGRAIAFEPRSLRTMTGPTQQRLDPGVRPSGRIAELLALALRHHRSGQLAEAEVRYREILAIDPNHVDGLHLLGVVVHQIGRNKEAVDLIGKAIALNGQVPAFHNHIGLALHAIGRAEDAFVHYTRAIDLKPDFASARMNLGNILTEQGKLDEAVAQYQQVLVLKPDDATAHNNLGNVLKEQGKLGEAVAQYERALALKPDYAAAHNNLGNALKEPGQLDEAVGRYQQALALTPDFVEAHNNLANALREQGKLDEAVTHYRRALALKPDYADAHNNLGIALREQGKLDEAVAQYQQVLVLKPNAAEAHTVLGNIFREQGKLDEAVAQHQRALALRPDFAEAHNNLGVALQEQGKLDDAVAQLQRSLALRLDSAVTHNNLGVALRKQGKLDDAVAQHQRSLALRPDFAEAHYNLGIALREQGKLDDAIAQFQRSLALESSDADVHFSLGEVLREQGQLDEAVARYQQALALRPEHVSTLSSLSAALRLQGKVEEAMAALRQALALEPNFAGAHHNLGHVLRDLGRLGEARHAYQKAIELAPRIPSFYMSLVAMKRFAPGDADLAAMEQLAADPTSLPVEEQMCLGFALGKAYDDLGEHERSFRHLLGSNALKRQRTVYDEAALGRFARIREVFTPELMREKRDLGDPSSVPVFIIGMPRSGTTLIEQILASHPRIFGAGELMNMANALRKQESGPAKFPEAVSSMGGEQLRQLGANYIAAVQALAPNAELITDKMPHNFVFAGLVHLALPNARIIHTRRDPIDTCLSCFSKYFTGSHPYSYDLAELGRYYRAYEALMEHWRKVLPPSVMLEVQYEDVTADLEGQARRIVAHCGLEWDDACLSFHETQRPVGTASAVQVRQPIYRTSVGRWRPYAHLLGPLIEALRADPARDPGATNTGATHDDDSTSAKSALVPACSSHLGELPD